MFLFHVKSLFSFLRYLQKSKIYDVTDWTTNNYNTHILPNISRSKGNQTIKFSQLTECNIGSIFLEKPYKQCVGEYLWINNLKCLRFVFIVCPSQGLPKYNKVKTLTTSFYHGTIYITNKNNV